MPGIMTLSVPGLSGYAKIKRMSVTLPRIDQLLEPPSRYRSAEAARPDCWTADWVKVRLAEAFEIERRIPGGRVGPAVIRSSWRIDTVDSFSDRVHQGELAREEVWRTWARAGGATPQEVTRMEEAMSWPGSMLGAGPFGLRDCGMSGVLRGALSMASRSASVPCSRRTSFASRFFMARLPTRVRPPPGCRARRDVRQAAPNCFCPAGSGSAKIVTQSV